MRKPGSTCDSVHRLRTRRPAAITSSAAPAIWPAASSRRIRPVAALPPERPPASSTARSCRRSVCATGARPKAAPVTTASTALKSSARQSSATAPSRGVSGGRTRVSTVRSGQASRNPAPAPMPASRRCSVRSCRATRRGAPPIAVRMPISRSRVAARDRLRLATLAQAITQHDQCRRRQDPEPRGDPADQRGLQRHDREIAVPLVGHGPGELLADVALEQPQLGLGLCGRDARPEPRDERHVVAGPVARGVPRIERQRHPDLRPPRRQIDAGRQHADDLARAAVDDDRPADDAGVGPEAGAPQCVAQEHDGVAGRLIFAGAEDAAASRRDTEDAEQLGGNARAGDAHRRAVAGHREHMTVGVGGDVHRRQRAPRRGQPAAGIHGVGGHQPFRSRIRQPRHEDAVDEREDRGGGADPERDRQDGGHGIRGLAQQRSRAVAQVLDDALDEHRAARVPALVLGAFDTAEGAPRGRGRRRGGVAAGLAEVRFFGEVVGDLVGELRLDLATPRQGAPAEVKHVDDAVEHGTSSLIGGARAQARVSCTTCVMAAESRVQLSVSLASRVRPSRLSA